MSGRSSVIRFAMVASLGLWASVAGAQALRCQPLPREDEVLEPRVELRRVQDSVACMEAAVFQQKAAIEGKAVAGVITDSLGKPVSPDDVLAGKDEEADVKSRIDFKESFGLGMGLGYSWGRGPERIEEAEVVNGIVRVKRAKTNKPRLFFEAHKFLKTWKKQKFGVGPFISIQTGADDALSSWGVGLMFGARETATSEKGVAESTSNSWNLGIGYLWDDDVQLLGDGIAANQPLPSGETEIRYKRTSAGSVFMMFSRKF